VLLNPDMSVGEFLTRLEIQNVDNPDPRGELNERCAPQEVTFFLVHTRYMNKVRYVPVSESVGTLSLALIPKMCVSTSPDQANVEECRMRRIVCI
jgi:hypothetical protein